MRWDLNEILCLSVIVTVFTILQSIKKVLEEGKRKSTYHNSLTSIHIQGLNLEECCSTYDQIQRSLVQGPNQDVGNMIMEEEIQLEREALNERGEEKRVGEE